MKKIAVIADIHSNYLSFQRALEMIDKILPDGIIFLGDYVTDCPYPEITMEMLRFCRKKYRCWFVRGNREEYLLAHRQNPNDGGCRGSSTGSLLYTYQRLTESDLDFFAWMPICLDIEINGCPTITACHGSPVSAGEWIIDNAQLTEEYMQSVRGEVLLCGHTHRTVRVVASGKQAIFCPSVGIAPGEYGTAIGMLEQTDSGWHYENIPVEFDKELLLKQFCESGLVDEAPVWSMCNMKLFCEGRDYAIECVDLARAKARADGCTGPIIPEEYWEQAARELGVI